MAALVLAGCEKYDDSALKEDIKNLQTEVDQLKSEIEKIKTNITSIQGLIASLQEQDCVTAITEIKDEAGNVIAYKVDYKLASSATFYVKDTATAGIVEKDGKYYWAIGGKIVTVGGKEVEVSVAPKVEVRDGVLQVSYDGGTTWIDLVDTLTIIPSEDEDEVTFKLGDTEVTIPLVPAFAIKVSATVSNIAAGATIQLPYEVKGAAANDDVLVMVTYATEGWTVSIENPRSLSGNVSITAPDVMADANAIVQAVNNTTGAVSAQALTFTEGVLTIDNNAFTVEGEGGTIGISITTNINYSVDYGEVTWIHEAQAKAEVRTETIALAVDANNGLARIARISIKGFDGSVTPVTIAQKANCPDNKIHAMWGWQAYTDDAHGMTASDNITLAVIDDYLILSNAVDVNAMPVYNRWTGEYLGSNIVNTTGMSSDYTYRAICNDDAGHLIATSYSDAQILTYVWKNGIKEAPTAVVSGGLWHWGVANNEQGWTVKCTGDVTGTAMMTYYAGYKFIFIPIVNGNPNFSSFIGEWPNGITSSGYKGCAAKAIVSSASSIEEIKYVFSTANHNMIFGYDGGTSAVNFSAPSSHWWAADGYKRLVAGVDYIEVGGKCLMAVMNGTYAGTSTSADQLSRYMRLCVSDITASPSAGSFGSGYIFDSREGAISGGTAAVPGSGYTVTGMSSPISFVSGKTVLGDNPYQSADVCFAKAADGSVQVYALVPGQALWGYNMKF